MLPPKSRGTVTYVAPPGNYDVSVRRSVNSLKNDWNDCGMSKSQNVNVCLLGCGVGVGV